MKPCLMIFLVTLAAYTLTAGGHLFTTDEEIVARTTGSLATGQGMLIEPLGSGFASAAAARPDAQGREYGQYGLGQPLLAVPFYWAGLGLSHMGGDRFWRKVYGQPSFSPAALGVEPTARELAPRFMLSWFNILASSLLAVVLYGICLQVTGDTRASAWAALLYALGSVAWAHSRPFFTEICTTLFVMISLLCLLKAENGRRMTLWAALAGLAGGYALLVRHDAALVFPALSLYVMISLTRVRRAQGRSFWPVWCAFGVPMALMIAVWLGLNAWRFGGPLAFGHEDQPEGIAFSTPVLAGLYGLLLSVGRGMFFFSPALVLSFWGWGPLRAVTRGGRPWMGWMMGLMIVPFLLFQAKWQNFAGGWCWGPRHIFMIHALLAIPIAALLAWNWNGLTRVAALVFLLAGMGVQALGCSQDFIAFYTRFFRSPGNPKAFFVLYDPLDQAYWGQHYQLLFRATPQSPPQPVPLYPPAPIQESIYVPPLSVWAGYPRMLNEGMHDNLWLRLAQTPWSSPAPAASQAPRP